MTKVEAKEYIEDKKKLELKIIQLETQKVSDMTVAQVYGKLAVLKNLYYQHKQLTNKIRMIERLA